MIKILIIEDEIPARQKLKRMIQELNDHVEILAEVDRVDTAIQFLKSNSVDLIFSDIELLDGDAFEIYQQVKVTCPIIFATAYDQYWMNAFDSNGIAYLLKPFSKEKFLSAWEKFKTLRNTSNDESPIIERFSQLLQNHVKKQYKKRFIINTNQGMTILETENIQFFEASASVVFAIDNKGKKNILTESTLKEIEEVVDPTAFFRINRSELIHKTYIDKIDRYNKNTYAIYLKHYSTTLKTSNSSSGDFRKWLEEN